MDALEDLLFSSVVTPANVTTAGDFSTLEYVPNQDSVAKLKKMVDAVNEVRHLHGWKRGQQK